jgi:hypothetical protein
MCALCLLIVIVGQLTFVQLLFTCKKIEWISREKEMCRLKQRKISSTINNEHSCSMIDNLGPNTCFDRNVDHRV